MRASEIGKKCWKAVVFAKCGLWAPFEHPLISPISVFVETHFLPPVKMGAGGKRGENANFLICEQILMFDTSFCSF